MLWNKKTFRPIGRKKAKVGTGRSGRSRSLGDLEMCVRFSKLGLVGSPRYYGRDPNLENYPCSVSGSLAGFLGFGFHGL